MKSGTIFHQMLSLFLLLSFSVVLAQDNKALNDELYKTYKEKGLEQTMKVYKEKANKEYEGLQEPLNQLAYKLMMEDKDLEAAEKLFKAQIEEYPDEANPYDSYADLLLEKGNKEEAKKHFKKSAALAENISDKDEKLQMKRASLSKLAKLENRHKAMDILSGEWEVTQTGHRDGVATTLPLSYNSISYLPGESVMRVVHSRENNQACCERIVAYNALTQKYQMAFIDAVNPNGIEISEVEWKDPGNGKYEMIEHYPEDDQIKQAKHQISKTDENNIQWDIYLPKEGGNDWELVNEMRFKRKA